MRMGLHRRRYIHPQKQKFISLCIFAVVLGLLIIAGGFLLSKVHAVFEVRAVAFANGIATQAVNDATQEYLSANNLSSDAFVKVQTDSNNQPTSIQSNTSMMNQFRADLTERLSQCVERTIDQKIFIPFGSLFGNELLNGVGFNIPVKLAATNIIDVDFEDEFVSVGINQTKHSMYLKGRISISIITSTFHTNEQVFVKFPISETVIVGQVPTYYGNGSVTVPTTQN